MAMASSAMSAGRIRKAVARNVVLLLCLCLAAGWTRYAGAVDGTWVMVDTRTAELDVVRHGRVLERLHGISIGRGGVTHDRRRGDGSTPLGIFHVAWVNSNSLYHRFFGFDYPTEDYAKRAWYRGRIDYYTYRAIVTAVQEGRTPPQDTALGGYLGIHGLGSGDRRLHRRTNWTRGCIALTNEQIDGLARWITVGTKVVVK